MQMCLSKAKSLFSLQKRFFLWEIYYQNIQNTNNVQIKYFYDISTAILQNIKIMW